MKNILYIIVGTIVGLLAAGLIWITSAPPRGEAVVLLPLPTEVPITVHVTGSVVNPGLYELPRNSRINDAILIAGGFLPDADTSYINLAALAEDGAQIHVPALLPGLTIGGTGLLININTASQTELESLPGIGPTLASQIINYRQQYGFFNVIEDIKNVPGIGEAAFEQIKNQITVSP